MPPVQRPSVACEHTPRQRGSGVTVIAVCAWSGGKDSALAFHCAVDAGMTPRMLLAMTTFDDARTRSNGVARSVLEAQAAALGVELLTVPTTWEQYEEDFGRALRHARSLGAEAVVYGDIDNPTHRRWGEQLAGGAGLAAAHPLWRADPMEIVCAIGDQYVARIVAVRSGLLEQDFLGRIITESLGRELLQRGLDPCGERGEYHTLVEDAPSYKQRLQIRYGGISEHGGLWHLDADVGVSDVIPP